VVLRLPYAVKDVFSHWLEAHYPSKKDRVLSRLREMRGGNLNVSTWGSRMTGEGVFADQIHDLFTVACRRAGLTQPFEVSTDSFRRPGGVQLNLL
jgi:DNA repair photolyase